MRINRVIMASRETVVGLNVFVNTDRSIGTEFDILQNFPDGDGGIVDGKRSTWDDSFILRLNKKSELMLENGIRGEYTRVSQNIYVKNDNQFGGPRGQYRIIKRPSILYDSVSREYVKTPVPLWHIEYKPTLTTLLSDFKGSKKTYVEKTEAELRNDYFSNLYSQPQWGFSTFVTDPYKTVYVDAYENITNANSSITETLENVNGAALSNFMLTDLGPPLLYNEDTINDSLINAYYPWVVCWRQYLPTETEKAAAEASQVAPTPDKVASWQGSPGKNKELVEINLGAPADPNFSITPVISTDTNITFNADNVIYGGEVFYTSAKTDAQKELIPRIFFVNRDRDVGNILTYVPPIVAQEIEKPLRSKSVFRDKKGNFDASIRLNFADKKAPDQIQRIPLYASGLVDNPGDIEGYHFIEVPVPFEGSVLIGDDIEFFNALDQSPELFDNLRELDPELGGYDGNLLYDFAKLNSSEFDTPRRLLLTQDVFCRWEGELTFNGLPSVRATANKTSTKSYSTFNPTNGLSTTTAPTVFQSQEYLLEIDPGSIRVGGSVHPIKRSDGTTGTFADNDSPYFGVWNRLKRQEGGHPNDGLVNAVDNPLLPPILTVWNLPHKSNNETQADRLAEISEIPRHSDNPALLEDGRTGIHRAFSSPTRNFESRIAGHYYRKSNDNGYPAWYKKYDITTDNGTDNNNRKASIKWPHNDQNPDKRPGIATEDIRIEYDSDSSPYFELRDYDLSGPDYSPNSTTPFNPYAAHDPRYNTPYTPIFKSRGYQYYRSDGTLSTNLNDKRPRYGFQERSIELGVPISFSWDGDRFAGSGFSSATSIDNNNFEVLTELESGWKHQINKGFYNDKDTKYAGTFNITVDGGTGKVTNIKWSSTASSTNNDVAFFPGQKIRVTHPNLNGFVFYIAETLSRDTQTANSPLGNRHTEGWMAVMNPGDVSEGAAISGPFNVFPFGATPAVFDDYNKFRSNILTRESEFNFETNNFQAPKSNLVFNIRNGWNSNFEQFENLTAAGYDWQGNLVLPDGPDDDEPFYKNLTPTNGFGFPFIHFQYKFTKSNGPSSTVRLGLSLAHDWENETNIFNDDTETYKYDLRARLGVTPILTRTSVYPPRMFNKYFVYCYLEALDRSTGGVVDTAKAYKYIGHDLADNILANEPGVRKANLDDQIDHADFFQPRNRLLFGGGSDPQPGNHFGGSTSGQFKTIRIKRADRIISEFDGTVSRARINAFLAVDRTTVTESAPDNVITLTLTAYEDRAIGTSHQYRIIPGDDLSKVDIDDFIGLDSLNGFFTIGNDLKSSFALVINPDRKNEGAENVRIELVDRPIVSASFTIEDTSTLVTADLSSSPAQTVFLDQGSVIESVTLSGWGEIGETTSINYRGEDEIYYPKYKSLKAGKILTEGYREIRPNVNDTYTRAGENSYIASNSTLEIVKIPSSLSGILSGFRLTDFGNDRIESENYNPDFVESTSNFSGFVSRPFIRDTQRIDTAFHHWLIDFVQNGNSDPEWHLKYPVAGELPYEVDIGASVGKKEWYPQLINDIKNNQIDYARPRLSTQLAKEEIIWGLLNAPDFIPDTYEAGFVLHPNTFKWFEGIEAAERNRHWNARFDDLLRDNDEVTQTLYSSGFALKLYSLIPQTSPSAKNIQRFNDKLVFPINVRLDGENVVCEILNNFMQFEDRGRVYQRVSSSTFRGLPTRDELVHYLGFEVSDLEYRRFLGQSSFYFGFLPVFWQIELEADETQGDQALRWVINKYTNNKNIYDNPNGFMFTSFQSFVEYDYYDPTYNRRKIRYYQDSNNSNTSRLTSPDKVIFEIANSASVINDFQLGIDNTVNTMLLPTLTEIGEVSAQVTDYRTDPQRWIIRDRFWPYYTYYQDTLLISDTEDISQVNFRPTENYRQINENYTGSNIELIASYPIYRVVASLIDPFETDPQAPGYDEEFADRNRHFEGYPQTPDLKIATIYTDSQYLAEKMQEEMLQEGIVFDATIEESLPIASNTIGSISVNRVQRISDLPVLFEVPGGQNSPNTFSATINTTGINPGEVVPFTITAESVDSPFRGRASDMTNADISIIGGSSSPVINRTSATLINFALNNSTIDPNGRYIFTNDSPHQYIKFDVKADDFSITRNDPDPTSSITLDRYRIQQNSPSQLEPYRFKIIKDVYNIAEQENLTINLDPARNIVACEAFEGDAFRGIPPHVDITLGSLGGFTDSSYRAANPGYPFNSPDFIADLTPGTSIKFREKDGDAPPVNSSFGQPSYTITSRPRENVLRLSGTTAPGPGNIGQLYSARQVTGWENKEILQPHSRTKRGKRLVRITFGLDDQPFSIRNAQVGNNVKFMYNPDLTKHASTVYEYEPSPAPELLPQSYGFIRIPYGIHYTATQQSIYFPDSSGFKGNAWYHARSTWSNYPALTSAEGLNRWRPQDGPAFKDGDTYFPAPIEIDRFGARVRSWEMMQLDQFQDSYTILDRGDNWIEIAVPLEKDIFLTRNSTRLLPGRTDIYPHVGMFMYLADEDIPFTTSDADIAAARFKYLGTHWADDPVIGYQDSFAEERLQKRSDFLNRFGNFIASDTATIETNIFNWPTSRIRVDDATILNTVNDVRAYANVFNDEKMPDSFARLHPFAWRHDPRTLVNGYRDPNDSRTWDILTEPSGFEGKIVGTDVEGFIPNTLDLYLVGENPTDEWENGLLYTLNGSKFLREKINTEPTTSTTLYNSGVNNPTSLELDGMTFTSTGSQNVGRIVYGNLIQERRGVLSGGFLLEGTRENATSTIRFKINEDVNFMEGDKVIKLQLTDQRLPPVEPIKFKVINDFDDIIPNSPDRIITLNDEVSYNLFNKNLEWTDDSPLDGVFRNAIGVLKVRDATGGTGYSDPYVGDKLDSINLIAENDYENLTPLINLSGEYTVNTFSDIVYKYRINETDEEKLAKSRNGEVGYRVGDILEYKSDTIDREDSPANHIDEYGGLGFNAGKLTNNEKSNENFSFAIASKDSPGLLRTIATTGFQGLPDSPEKLWNLNHSTFFQSNPERNYNPLNTNFHNLNSPVLLDGNSKFAIHKKPNGGWKIKDFGLDILAFGGFDYRLENLGSFNGTYTFSNDYSSANDQFAVFTSGDNRLQIYYGDSIRNVTEPYPSRISTITEQSGEDSFPNKDDEYADYYVEHYPADYITSVPVDQLRLTIRDGGSVYGGLGVNYAQLNNLTGNTDWILVDTRDTSAPWAHWFTPYHYDDKAAAPEVKPSPIHNYTEADKNTYWHAGAYNESYKGYHWIPANWEDYNVHQPKLYYKKVKDIDHIYLVLDARLRASVDDKTPADDIVTLPHALVYARKLIAVEARKKRGYINYPAEGGINAELESVVPVDTNFFPTPFDEEHPMVKFVAEERAQGRYVENGSGEGERVVKYVVYQHGDERIVKGFPFPLFEPEHQIDPRSPELNRSAGRVLGFGLTETLSALFWIFRALPGILLINAIGQLAKPRAVLFDSTDSINKRTEAWWDTSYGTAKPPDFIPDFNTYSGNSPSVKQASLITHISAEDIKGKELFYANSPDLDKTKWYRSDNNAYVEGAKVSYPARRTEDFVQNGIGYGWPPPPGLDIFSISIDPSKRKFIKYWLLFQIERLEGSNFTYENQLVEFRQPVINETAPQIGRILRNYKQIPEEEKDASPIRIEEKFKLNSINTTYFRRQLEYFDENAIVWLSNPINEAEDGSFYKLTIESEPEFTITNSPNWNPTQEDVSFYEPTRGTRGGPSLNVLNQFPDYRIKIEKKINWNIVKDTIFGDRILHTQPIRTAYIHILINEFDTFSTGFAIADGVIAKVAGRFGDDRKENFSLGTVTDQTVTPNVFKSSIIDNRIEDYKDIIDREITNALDILSNSPLPSASVTREEFPPLQLDKNSWLPSEDSPNFGTITVSETSTKTINSITLSDFSPKY